MTISFYQSHASLRADNLKVIKDFFLDFKLGNLKCAYLRISQVAITLPIKVLLGTGQ